MTLPNQSASFVICEAQVDCEAKQPPSVLVWCDTESLPPSRDWRPSTNLQCWSLGANRMLEI